jgi:hypothetical protein
MPLPIIRLIIAVLGQRQRRGYAGVFLADANIFSAWLTYHLLTSLRIYSHVGQIIVAEIRSYRAVVGISPHMVVVQYF